MKTSPTEPPNQRVREESYTDLASNAVFMSYHSYLSAIRSTSPTEVPSQRIGETRYTDLVSGKVFTALPPGLTATGRVSKRREWSLLGTFTREADGEDERFGKRELKRKRGRGRGRKAGLSVELKPVIQNNQTFSPFLRLPPEIRTQIYDLLSPPSQVIEVLYHHFQRDVEVRNGISYRKYTKGGLAYYKNLPVTCLWRVCRQIYQEKTYNMYDQNTFVFHDMDTMQRVLTTLSLTQRNDIKRVCLTSFLNAHDISETLLKRFHGLETIVALLDGGFTRPGRPYMHPVVSLLEEQTQRILKGKNKIAIEYQLSTQIKNRPTVDHYPYTSMN